jgi:hypothetical protein
MTQIYTVKQSDQRTEILLQIISFLAGNNTWVQEEGK